MGVLNLVGRVFMNSYEDPFRVGRECLEEMKRQDRFEDWAIGSL